MASDHIDTSPLKLPLIYVEIRMRCPLRHSIYMRYDDNYCAASACFISSARTKAPTSSSIVFVNLDCQVTVETPGVRRQPYKGNLT